jgi:hypothetical protein
MVQNVYLVSMSIDIHQVAAGNFSVMICHYETEDAEPEMAVMRLLPVYENGLLNLYSEGNDVPHIRIYPEEFEDIKPVPEAIKDIMQGADYYIVKYSRPKPDDANEDDYIATGLKWPGSED